MADHDALSRVFSRLDPDEAADRIFQSLRLRLDRYAHLGGQASADEIRETARRNVDMLRRRLIEGATPKDTELERLRESARHRAAEGVALEEMLQAYRLGARIAWSMLLEAARGEEELRALVRGVDGLLLHMDLVSSLVERTYLDVREKLVSESEREARQALELLDEDRTLRPEERALLESVGVPSQPTYVPFAAVVPGGSIIRHAELAAWIRSRRLGIALTEGSRVSGVLWEDPSLVDVELDRDGVIALGPPTRRHELEAGREEARLLADLLVERGIAGRARVEEYVPELLVASAPRLGRAAVERVLTPLSDDLRRTMHALVEHDFDRGRTSAALHIHRNTLAYRVSRIEEQTGMDLHRGRDLALAYLATAFVHMHEQI